MVTLLLKLDRGNLYISYLVISLWSKFHRSPVLIYSETSFVEHEMVTSHHFDSPSLDDTASKLASDAEAIWKYQRYHLVLDFCVRPRLPAPLNVFSFLIMLGKALWKCLECDCGPHTHQKDDNAQKSQFGSYMGDAALMEDSYWRTMAKAYILDEESKSKKDNLQIQQMDNIYTMAETLEYQKSSMRTMKVRLDELEKLMLASRISLEEIKHALNKDDDRFSITKEHLLSRQSPYPGTKVKRFPLADRYVPWEVLYSIYDPVVYSKPKGQFPLSIREFVDEDLLQMQETVQTAYRAPILKWNFRFKNVAGSIVDRTSWILQEDNKPFIYKLDSNGLPVNPMGRTGLRGRGNLCRWGPNHSAYVVVTRWSNSGGDESCSSQDDQKTLEVLLTRTNEDCQYTLSLPGNFEHGESNLLNTVRRVFLPNESKTWTNEDMINYFAEFATVSVATDITDFIRPDAEVMDKTKCEMEYSMIYKGYIDDRRNTDNAWIESEVWNFHYTGKHSVNVYNMPNLRWKKCAPNLETKLLPSHAAILCETQQKITLENIN